MAMSEGGVGKRRFAIHWETEDCLIRLENHMYGFGGVAGRSAASDRYAVEDYIRELGQETIDLRVELNSAKSALLAARGGA